MPVSIRTAPQSPRRDLYAQSAVLVSENPHDFTALFDELCQELRPVGVLEEDQVATIAKLLFRKPRLAIFQRAAQARDVDSKARVAQMMGKPTEEMRRAQDNLARAKILATYAQEEQEKGHPEKAKGRDKRINEAARALAPRIDQIEEMLGIGPSEADKAKKAEQAALLNIKQHAYIEHLDLVERLDAAIERTFHRLAIYQRTRMTGSTSVPKPKDRSRGWGRVRQ
jgi:hypothetical protein